MIVKDISKRQQEVEEYNSLIVNSKLFIRLSKHLVIFYILQVSYSNIVPLFTKNVFQNNTT